MHAAEAVSPPLFRNSEGAGYADLPHSLLPRTRDTIMHRVCYDPPNEHASEGGRDDRGVPYHAESTLSSAQVLKLRPIAVRENDAVVSGS